MLVSGLSEQRRRLVLAAVLAADPSLTPDRVEKALAAVGEHPAALRILATALAADPTALLIGAPPLVGQLVLALRAQGATALPVATVRGLRTRGHEADPIPSTGRGLRPLPTP